MPLRLPARFVAALSLAVAGTTFAAPVYHLVDLGENYIATAINKNGVVVGYKAIGFDVPSIYRDGHWNAIEKGMNGHATGVDAAGDAIGWQWAGPAMFWPHGPGLAGIVVEPKFPASETDLAGVNDHKIIAGSALAHKDRQWHCFRWENGIGKDLHSPGACFAAGINRNGWIIGNAASPSGNPREGFIWADGHFYWFDEQPTASPAQINDEGHVAGQYDSPADGFGHAFLYDGQQFIDLGVLPGAWQSWTNGLNDHDEVVGHTASGFGDWLYLYTGGQMLQLTPLIDNLGDWDLTTVAGIDNDGDIIGTGNIAGIGHSWMAVRVSN